VPPSDSYSVERLLDAFAKVPAHVAVMRGPDHVYAFLNEAYAKVVGIEDPIGKPFGASNHPATIALRAMMDRVYETGEPWAAQEMRVAAIGDERQDRFFNVHFIPLRGEGNAIDGVMLHSFDVTELVRARQRMAASEAQLLHVQKLESLGVLAGGIAHDFNNMLAAVQGSISLATLMLAPEHAVQASLRDALAGVRRASDLTRQLLAYSGKGSFQVLRIDLSAQVEELAQLLETTLPKKVQLRLELGRDLPPIEADPAQVQQIVMNLVINGAEAMGDERGTVLVTTGAQDVDANYAASLFAPGAFPPGRYVAIEVHDTGSGMDEATQARIFDPFFSTKFTGRGLGLAAVLGIVKAHKGAIKVYSTPGKGTTFKVLFPAAEGSAERPAKTPPPTVLGKGLALVIDDDRGVRLVVRHLLEFFGFDVIEAADGRRGVEQFAAHAAEVKFVLLDMTMPELSGEETFRELRSLRPDLPVILSSGYNEVEATRRFCAKGYAAFLPKPFTPEDLARCIRATEKGAG
jgi:two-component system cell cycle sensor histidine kinase/response regulator CckA